MTILYLSFTLSFVAFSQEITYRPPHDITNILTQGISIPLSPKTSENLTGHQMMTRSIKTLIYFNCSSQLYKEFLFTMLQSKRYFIKYLIVYIYIAGP